VEHKTRNYRLRQRLLAASIGGLMAAAAAPALADSEIDALKRELAEQRKLIEQLLADRAADKQVQAAAPVAVTPAGPAASPGLPPVTIYGIIDGGVEHITNIKDTTNGTAGSVNRMPSITATLPSRVGISANRSLGDGLSGVATAELGFNSDDGTLGQGGRVFGRQLFAGVQTPYGTVTYGRQWSMLFHAMLGTDILGPNVYALGSMDPYLASMRYDNSVAWRGSFGGLSLGALYSTGRSVVANGGAPASGNCAGEIAGTNQCRGWSLMAKYDTPVWGVAAAIDEQRGGTGAKAFFFNGAPPFDFARAQDKDRRSNVGGYVKFGQAKVSGGWLGREVDATIGTVKSNGYYLAASYDLTPKITIDGGWNRMENSTQDRNADLYAVRGFYKLDKALLAYLQFGHISNSANAQYSLSVGPNVAPPAGGSQTGTMIGLRYHF
jgi:predicted porin